MPSADTPFTPSAAHLQRIRERAYHLWESEGRPEGQAEAYWERAEQLDALESDLPAQRPNPLIEPPHPTAEGTLIEQADLQENLGEFPARFTDQGETMATPQSRKIAKQFREGRR